MGLAQMPYMLAFALTLLMSTVYIRHEVETLHINLDSSCSASPFISHTCLSPDAFCRATPRLRFFESCSPQDVETLHPGFPVIFAIFTTVPFFFTGASAVYGLIFLITFYLKDTPIKRMMKALFVPKICLFLAMISFSLIMNLGLKEITGLITKSDTNLRTIINLPGPSLSDLRWDERPDMTSSKSKGMPSGHAMMAIQFLLIAEYLPIGVKEVFQVIGLTIPFIRVAQFYHTYIQITFGAIMGFVIGKLLKTYAITDEQRTHVGAMGGVTMLSMYINLFVVKSTLFAFYLPISIVIYSIHELYVEFLRKKE
jgi:membrane-associated phospholipid phosphatase